MPAYNFEQVMKWSLGKGRQDSHAMHVALELGKSVAAQPRNDGLIKSVLPTLLSEFPDVVWPPISQAVASTAEDRLALDFLLGGFFNTDGPPPAIVHLPEDTLFAWCYANPDHGPAFAAKTLPVITRTAEDDQEWQLSPVILRLLDEFGEREDVQEAVHANIVTVTWGGSMADYFALYEKPLAGLRDHTKRPIRRFARKLTRAIHSETERIGEEDAARDLSYRWHI